MQIAHNFDYTSSTSTQYIEIFVYLSATDLPQADPISQVCGTSLKTYLRKGKKKKSQTDRGEVGMKRMRNSRGEETPRSDEEEVLYSTGEDIP